MKKRWLGYVVLGLLFYFLFLVAFAPAKWATWGLARLSQGRLNLNQATGSLWHGQGELVLFQPGTPLYHVGHATWRINPLPAVIGRLSLYLQVSGASTEMAGHIGLARGGVQLHDLKAAFPPALLTTFYPAAALIAPAGQMRFNASTLRIERTGIEGEAELIWQNAASNLSSVNPLGDYRLYLNGRGKIAAVNLETTRGDLHLSGKGEWRVDEGYLQFQGTAKQLARAAELEPLLMLFGNDQGKGQRSFVINQRINLFTG
ncbi:MAG TPA: type II secretion system protein N [Acidiferrobacterales bacterium]|nr:type II secretion system protein N [Acidiferrobacterales bacterium]